MVDEIETAILGSRHYRKAARETSDAQKASMYWAMVEVFTDVALMIAAEEGAEP